MVWMIDFDSGICTIKGKALALPKHTIMADTKKPEVKRPRGRPRKKIENRGGAREGAGRKPTGNAKVLMQLYVSKQVKALCPLIRERGIGPSAEFEKMILRYASALGLLNDETKHE